MNGQAAAYSSRCRIREAEPYHRKKLFANSRDTEKPRRFTPCSPVSPVLKNLAEARQPEPEARYLAASCAHFASVVKNAFAAGGGSITPVSDVRNGTMRP
jgi:hypothetical protein